MRRKKAVKSSGPEFRPCNREGCMGGMVRVVRNGVSAVRECTCILTWRNSQRAQKPDGKAAAANA